MNARTARRKRIIRVRTVEHQMAEANLARANGELASLVELSKRLEVLRAYRSYRARIGSRYTESFQTQVIVEHRAPAAARQHH